MQYGTKEIADKDIKVVIQEVEQLLVKSTKHMNEMINHNGTVEEFLALVDVVRNQVEVAPKKEEVTKATTKAPGSATQPKSTEKVPENKAPDQPVI